MWLSNRWVFPKVFTKYLYLIIIKKRCVLHGLFTELACMENFRLNPNVATVYDYGVTSTDYVIVMKKYQHSLKEWRLLQKGTL